MCSISIIYQRIPPLPPLNIYLDTWHEQKILDFDMPKGEIFFLLDILMQIMQVTWYIGKAHQELVNSLANHLYHGIPRAKFSGFINGRG